MWEHFLFLFNSFMYSIFGAVENYSKWSGFLCPLPCASITRSPLCTPLSRTSPFLSPLAPCSILLLSPSSPHLQHHNHSTPPHPARGKPIPTTIAAGTNTIVSTFCEFLLVLNTHFWCS